MLTNIIRAVLCVLALGFFLASSQEMVEGPLLEVAESEEYGSYLTDAEGRSLYLYLHDKPEGATEEVQSVCQNECEALWPPLTVEGEPTAGEGVAASLLGTIEREDGSTQVTYNDWPLYYYAEDQNPGDATGQGVGEVWYLVSPYGEAIQPQEEASEEQQGQEQESDQAANAEVDVMTLNVLKNEGRQVYGANCAVCHGQNGGGGEGPALASNRKLIDNEHVVDQILYGGYFMPAFKDQLSDREVATVATYIRNSWGNDFGMVTEEEVSAAR